MRLVIRNRYGSAAGGLRRYKGSGIFSSIGRKLFSSGLKKVINVATKANLSQKLANAVVNGAQSAGENLGKTVSEKIGKVAGEKVVNTLKKTLKRKKASPEEQQIVVPPSKQAIIDVNHLINGSDSAINGSGIVFD